MSRRRRLLSLLGMAAAAAAVPACTETFPDAPVEGQFTVTIEKQNWPNHLLLGDTATELVVQVVESGRRVLDAPLQWSDSLGRIPGIAAGADSSGNYFGRVKATSLGMARVVVSLPGDDVFAATRTAGDLPVVLAGVRLVAPDTVRFDAIGDSANAAAAGLDMYGGAVQTVGFDWRLEGAPVLDTASAGPGRAVMRVRSREAGAARLVVSHPLCAGTCEDTVVVVVEQEVAELDVTPASDTLLTQDTLRLTAAATDRNGHPIAGSDVQWATLDAAVATVDAGGRVTGAGQGSTWIVATAGAATDSARVQVQDAGTMAAEIADAPSDYYQSAVLYISGVYVPDATQPDGRRYLTREEKSYDLLTLRNGVSAPLATARVLTGSYTQVFVAIDSAVVTLVEPYTFTDTDSPSRTILPAASDAAADLSDGVSVAKDATVEVVIDFDVNRSFQIQGNPTDGFTGVTMEPKLRAVDRATEGSVLGSVGASSGSPELGGVTVQGVRTDVADGDTATAVTNSAGSFTMHFLPAGSYEFSILDGVACYDRGTPVALTVVAGQEATGANLTIDPLAIDSLVVTPANPTITAIEGTAQLVATAYSGGSGVEVPLTWNSKATATATVTQTGRVTAVAPGTAEVVVEACGYADTATVVVDPVTATVAITPDPAKVPLGGTLQLGAEAKDANGHVVADETFTWQSENTAIATVDGTGLVSGIAEGATAIIATSSTGVSDTVDVSVAVLIAIGDSVADVFTTVPTVHTYDIDLTAGQVIDIYAFSPDTTTFPWVDIYGPGGTLLAGNGGYNSRMGSILPAFTAPTTGTYEIQVGSEWADVVPANFVLKVRSSGMVLNSNPSWGFAVPAPENDGMISDTLWLWNDGSGSGTGWTATTTQPWLMLGANSGTVPGATSSGAGTVAATTFYLPSRTALAPVSGGRTADLRSSIDFGRIGIEPAGPNRLASSVDPQRSSPSNATPLVVSVDPSGFAQGHYSGLIQIMPDDDWAGPVTLWVDLIVHDAGFETVAYLEEPPHGLAWRAGRGLAVGHGRTVGWLDPESGARSALASGDLVSEDNALTGMALMGELLFVGEVESNQLLYVDLSDGFTDWLLQPGEEVWSVTSTPESILYVATETAILEYDPFGVDPPAAIVSGLTPGMRAVEYGPASGLVFYTDGSLLYQYDPLVGTPELVADLSAYTDGWPITDMEIGESTNLYMTTNGGPDLLIVTSLGQFVDAKYAPGKAPLGIALADGFVYLSGLNPYWAIHSLPIGDRPPAEPAALIDIAGTGTRLSFTDRDEDVSLVGIGFNFSYWGQSFSSVHMHTNGYLSFGNGSIAYLNENMPSTNAPNGVVAPFWDDFNLTNAGDVFYELQGEPGTRRLIVQWNQAPLYDWPSARLTFQAILYEGSNDIEFRYGPMLGDPNDTGASETGSSATIGIENVDGTADALWSFDTANAVFEGAFIAFHWNGSGYDIEYR